MKEHEIQLLTKQKNGLGRILFSRLGLVVLLLLLQLVWIFSLFKWFSQEFPHYTVAVVVFDFIMMLYLVNSKIDPSAKTTWLLLIAVAPLFGSVLLLYTQSDIGHRALRKRIRQLVAESKHSLTEDNLALKKLKLEDADTYGLAKYLQRTNDNFPVYQDTKVTYFPIGEAKFKEMLHQLRQAKRFIFLEYFIIAEGKMWGEILAILAQKVKEGVEVRVMYDGMCEFTTLSVDYPQRLAKLSIKAKMFSPIHPFVSTYYNYRDHRKILVIDGQVAFTGGVNLADEYINELERFGHWKDTAIMLEGKAVKTFTQLFLQMWNITEKEVDFSKYLEVESKVPAKTSGYVIPYADFPLEEEKVAENVYMDILNRAHNYVHIMTPYLILDGKMERALTFAAERGVDVELILPGIPDKPIPYALAKTHFKQLLQAGVKIYLYTPGFVHAKVFVADDKKAVVGTINLDYRSLYHHFECAAFMYKTDCIPAIAADFEETKAKSTPVTLESLQQEPVTTKVVGALTKTIAPLL